MDYEIEATNARPGKVIGPTLVDTPFCPRPGLGLVDGIVYDLDDAPVLTSEDSLTIRTTVTLD